MVVSAGGAAAASASCSAADPQTINFSERPHGPDQTSGGPIGGPDGGDDSSGPATEGGTDGAMTGPIDAFTTAKAFNPAGQPVGGPSTNASHNFAGSTPTTNPAGQNCLDCHKNGGAATAWGIGGTVYTTSAATAPVQGAEVRIVDKDGKELALVYTDNLGNFWTSDITAVPDGAKIGVRTATVKKLMNTALTATGGGGCAQAKCHIAGGQGPISLQ
jgi:hypothetical protein